MTELSARVQTGWQRAYPAGGPTIALYQRVELIGDQNITPSPRRCQGGSLVYPSQATPATLPWSRPRAHRDPASPSTPRSSRSAARSAPHQILAMRRVGPCGSSGLRLHWCRTSTTFSTRSQLRETEPAIARNQAVAGQQTIALGRCRAPRVAAITNRSPVLVTRSTNACGDNLRRRTPLAGCIGMAAVFARVLRFWRAGRTLG